MNIYLITGSSFRLIDEEIKSIVKKNYYTTVRIDVDGSDYLFEECGYKFFLDDMKYLVVKNFFDTSRKNYEQDEEKILKYFEKPSDNVTLIFIEEKIDSRKKVFKKFKTDFVHKKIEIDYKNIYNLVNDYVSQNGYRYDYDLSKFFVNNYALNIDLIYNELDKVFLFYNNRCTLNTSMVEKVVSLPLMQNSFKFIDAVVERNLKKSLNLLNDLITCKTEIISLIILLAREFKNMTYIKEYTKLKKSSKEMEGLLKMQDWQLKKCYTNSLNYTESELKDIIIILANADEAIKKGLQNDYSAIHLCILNICV